MKLVSNASPLIFLTKIDALGWLQQCFQPTIVPSAVVAEVGMELPDFIQQQPLSDLGAAYVNGAVGRLHRGELEAMVLAREQNIAWIAMDDRLARRRATQMGLQPIGTLGLLVLFHQRRLLDTDSAIAKLDTLVNEHGLYLSKTMYDEARRIFLAKK